MNNRKALSHPIFLISLALLLSNDFYFKATFHNALTCKLSDFAGMIVLPVFLAACWPKLSSRAALISGVLFVVWKTPLVSPLITAVNDYTLLTFQRIIDYTDYIALLVLPLAHHLVRGDYNHLSFPLPVVQRLGYNILLLVSAFAICATSQIRPTEMPRGTVFIGKQYTIRKTVNGTLDMIRSMGYTVAEHEAQYNDSLFNRTMHYYQVDNIMIRDDAGKPVDTIDNVKFELWPQSDAKTNIRIVNVTLSKDGNIQRWQTLRFLRKKYKALLRQNLIEELKK